jgi:adenosylcobinamide amidohydrolase
VKLTVGLFKTVGETMHWETLAGEPCYALRRAGRFLVAELTEPHQVLSTSARNGGQVSHVRFLVNHQSCEGTGHHDRHAVIVDGGLEAYHNRVCDEAGVPADSAAVMGTAANMNYVAVAHEADDGLRVTAAVTAGVEGNATAAGEPAAWRETPAGMQKVPEYTGTINTMLLVNRPMTPATLARAVVTMTEGKTAALQRLAVPSKRHVDLATGTGTDQFCLAAPVSGRPVLTSASTHTKFGELIGVAVRRATMEALRWQNGLETSYTRGLFHALGRFGVKEATIFDDVAPLLSEGDLELLRKNAKAVFYEPLVGASAHALATTCDRVRYGTIPGAVAADAIVQQAASLAANLAAQVHRWAEFRARLRPYAEGDVKALVAAAVALGWSEKWRTS